jgi:hypothetical protein
MSLLSLQAFTTAYANCTSTDIKNAVGCGFASAAASAWARATYSAHAKAVANATNNCNCEDGVAFASALANGTAEVFSSQLCADVTARANAEVCVTGAGGILTAEVSDFQACLQRKYALVFAKATARALTEGNCEVGTLASAEIEAITGVEFENDFSCD